MTWTVRVRHFWSVIAQLAKKSMVPLLRTYRSRLTRWNKPTCSTSISNRKRAANSTRRLTFDASKKAPALTMTEFSAVWVTVPNEEVATKVSEALLNERVAACVNQIPGVKSMYWWDGKIQSDQEIILMIKTKTTLLEELTAIVKKTHTYTTPEVISAPLGAGNPDYYAWIASSTK